MTSPLPQHSFRLRSLLAVGKNTRCVWELSVFALMQFSDDELNSPHGEMSLTCNPKYCPIYKSCLTGLRWDNT